MSTEYTSRSGEDRIWYAEPSNDGNLDGGWSIQEPDEEHPTLCEEWEPVGWLDRKHAVASVGREAL